MEHRTRKHIASGILLILIGLIFLAFRLIPVLHDWVQLEFSWPMIILIVALGLIVIGALVGEPDMLVPACIVGGIGGILYLQNAGILTWQSWAYLWTLIPGFVGLGVLLAGLLKWNKKEIVDGLETMLVSLVLFVVFGTLLGSLFGFFPFKAYLPYLLIALGLFLFVKALVGKRQS